MSGEGGAIAEVREALDYLVHMAIGHDYADGYKISTAEDSVLAALGDVADLLAAERQRGREEALREAAVTVRALTEVGDLTREPWDNGYRCAVRDALRDINAALADSPAESEGA